MVLHSRVVQILPVHLLLDMVLGSEMGGIIIIYRVKWFKSQTFCAKRCEIGLMSGSK